MGTNTDRDIDRINDRRNKMKMFDANVDRYLNTRINTQQFQEYLENKADKTEEEMLALKESKKIRSRVVSVILAFVSLFGFFGIGVAVGHYGFGLEIPESIMIGIIASGTLGIIGIILTVNMASYTQRHWYTYINKVTKIMNEHGYSTMGLMDKDFYKKFSRLKKSLGANSNIDQMIANEKMENYSRQIFRNIMVSLATIVIIYGIGAVPAFISHSQAGNNTSKIATAKEKYSKDQIIEKIKEDGEGLAVYYIEQETEVKGEKRVLYYYCTEESKIVTKLMTKVNSDNSYSIHYKTVSSDETPQSIMQSSEMNKVQ